jgi:transposase-like protein
MQFRPSHCPLPACSSSQPYRFRKKGFFRRQVDGRLVQRFLCMTCQRSFSVQTFRLDHRLKKPHLADDVFRFLVAKVTLRQTARALGCSRKTVEHRLDLIAVHCRNFHRRLLAKRPASLAGPLFQLDELETYEQHRRLQPLTVPVLIHKKSFFVLDARVAALPARGGLSQKLELEKARRAQAGKVRRSRSSAAVRACLQAARELFGAGARVRVETDLKKSYPAILRKVFGTRFEQATLSSKAPRRADSLLFPINLTLAMLRDGISRLVRRTWAASKTQARLEKHLWVWMVWRNYVRGRTNRERWSTPAMQLGLVNCQFEPAQVLRWRIFLPTTTQ